MIFGQVQRDITDLGVEREIHIGKVTASGGLVSVKANLDYGGRVHSDDRYDWI